MAVQYRSRVYREGDGMALPDSISSRKKIYERISYLAAARARGESTANKVIIEYRERGALGRWLIYETINIGPDGELS